MARRHENVAALSIGIAAAVLMTATLQFGRKRKRKRIWVRRYVWDRENYGAHTKLIPALREDNTKVYINFLRIPEFLYHMILKLIHPIIRRKTTYWRASISPSERLTVTLRYLATGDNYKSLSYLFRLGAFTIACIVPETCTAIYNVLRKKYVPDTDENSVDAHLITFSVEDRGSFRFAEARLREVRSREDPPGGSIVILVANKEDLVRSRDIGEEEGVVLAKKHGCKYTEVSAILNHKVDELLVGIIRQIRLRPQRGLDAAGGVTSCGVQIDQKQYGCIPKALFELFRRIMPRRDDVNKSCENLLQL